MGDRRLVYRRKLSDTGTWQDLSIQQHVALFLHRITGWLLLGWVVVHLGLPAVTSGPAVWNPLTELAAPVSKVVVVGLFAVLVFHTFNGVRLLAAELLGAGVDSTRAVFLLTLVVSGLSVAGLGVLL